MIGAVSNL